MNELKITYEKGFFKDGTGFLRPNEFRLALDLTGFSKSVQGKQLLEKADEIFEEKQFMDFDTFLALIWNKHRQPQKEVGPVRKDTSGSLPPLVLDKTMRRD